MRYGRGGTNFVWLGETRFMLGAWSGPAGFRAAVPAHRTGLRPPDRRPVPRGRVAWADMHMDMDMDMGHGSSFNFISHYYRSRTNDYALR